MLNIILEKIADVVGIASNKVQPYMKKGMIAEFWAWVDKKWYRSDLHR